MVCPVGYPGLPRRGAAHRCRRPRPRHRRAGTGSRGRDARPLRSEVPAVTDPDWVRHVIWWHVYPLGFVGAFPAQPAPTADQHRLLRIIDWLDHAVELGASGLALGPVFASRTD